LQTVTSCDSIINTELSVIPHPRKDEFVAICEGEAHDGFSENGIYTYFLEASSGCDTLVTLTLDVFENFSEYFIVSICPGEEHEGLSETGLYEFYFLNSEGCDSLVTIELTVLNENDPPCMASSISSIENDINIFPNPANDWLHINLKKNQTINLSIINELGQRFIDFENLDKEIIDISNLPSGIYFIMMRDTKDGRKVIKKILKN